MSPLFHFIPGDDDDMINEIRIERIKNGWTIYVGTPECATYFEPNFEGVIKIIKDKFKE